MALANDITANPGAYGGTAADKVYKLLGWLKNNTGNIRRVAATALTTPEVLTIDHRATTEKGIVTDQHLIRLDESIIDPILGTVKISSWIVLRVPRGTTVVTSAKMKDLLGRTIHSVLQSGVTDSILNGES